MKNIVKSIISGAFILIFILQIKAQPWQTVNISNITYHFNEALASEFPTADIGWILFRHSEGENCHFFIYKTTNKGISWFLSSPSFESKYQTWGDISFPDNSHGFIIHHNNDLLFDYDLLSYTNDGGSTWSTDQNGPFILGSVRIKFWMQIPGLNFQMIIPV